MKQEGADTALQEAIIVASDIFRKYPGKYNVLIKDLCTQLKRIDEPDAKAAMIWILGEYADLIDDVEKFIAYFTESFNDESIKVQLAALTACVKMYLRKPDESEEIVMSILKKSTEESDNPDLRD